MSKEERASEKCYVRQSSEVFSAGRLDAEYFQPKYYRLESAIRKCGHRARPLNDLIEPIRNGFDFRKFTAEGTPYIRVGDLANGRIFLETAERVLIAPEKVKENIRLRVGDVLFTRKGSYGNAAVVRTGQEHSIVSSEIMLLRLKVGSSVLPEYLAAYLNSFIGYEQVERRAHGGAFYSISQPDLGRVAIVLGPATLQERIRAGIAECQATLDESNRLIEVAKGTVEYFVATGLS